MYGSDSKDYRTEVPEELAGIIRLVRTGASDLVLSTKVLNEDIYGFLHDLYRQGATNITAVMRHGIKDPHVRTELCMELVDAANRRRRKVPAHYIPGVIATTAHLELCEPYIQTATDTLNNPEVLMMYGFFSNHPPNGALQIFEHYARHPLILAHLPDMLRFAALKRGGMNSYWYPIVEYPHRIIVKVGPQALPPLDAFCQSREALYQQLQAGDDERPPGVERRHDRAVRRLAPRSSPAARRALQPTFTCGRVGTSANPRSHHGPGPRERPCPTSWQRSSATCPTQ
jgi:hypothetical protein